jgi:hypothetical protein
MKVSRFDEALDVHTATEAELGARLERLWEQEPLLRPRPEMHDYQLTYPPAVQLEKRPGYQRAPTDAEYLGEAVGAFTAGGYYFHFGFCQYRCRYCFHYELLTKHSEELMSRYVNALALEMRRVRELTPGLKRALYFLGGGTPTALPPHLLERFLERLLFHFGPPMTAMSTVEAKPVTASEEKLQALARAGFRRINLGVQTLDPELYAFHHQKEDLRVAFDAIERARRCGFEFINIDIMTGLERQTPESWRKTLAELERLAQRRAGAGAVHPAGVEGAGRAVLPLTAARAARAVRAGAGARQSLVRRGAVPRARQLQLLHWRQGHVPQPPRRE